MASSKVTLYPSMLLEPWIALAKVERRSRPVHRRGLCWTAYLRFDLNLSILSMTSLYFAGSRGVSKIMEVSYFKQDNFHILLGSYPIVNRISATLPQAKKWL